MAIEKGGLRGPVEALFESGELCAVESAILALIGVAEKSILYVGAGPFVGPFGFCGEPGGADGRCQ